LFYSTVQHDTDDGGQAMGEVLGMYRWKVKAGTGEGSEQQ